MIELRMEDGRYAPRATCDTCGEPVTDPATAVVAFDMAVDAKTRTPYVAHKGRCHDAVDERIRAVDGFPGSNDFEQFIGDLLHNTGLRGKALTRALDVSKHLQEIGL